MDLSINAQMLKQLRDEKNLKEIKDGKEKTKFAIEQFYEKNGVYSDPESNENNIHRFCHIFYGTPYPSKEINITTIFDVFSRDGFEVMKETRANYVVVSWRDAQKGTKAYVIFQHCTNILIKQYEQRILARNNQGIQYPDDTYSITVSPPENAAKVIKDVFEEKGFTVENLINQGIYRNMLIMWE